MVDSSLEDDLLHVVGHPGTRSGSKPSRRRARSHDSSDDDDDYRSDEDDDDDDRSRGDRGGSKVPLKKRDMDKDEEEEDDEDDDGYGSDLSFGSDLYKDEEDRDRLNAMNELEREEILYERAEKRDNYIQRKQRQRDLRAKQQARSGDHSGNLLARRGAAATPAGPRSRQDDALGQLKAKQQAKAAKQQRQQDLDNMARKRRDKEAASRGKRDSPGRHEDSSSGDEDEYEARSQSEDEEDRREAYDDEEDEDDRDRGKPDPEAEIEDLQGILLRRSKLAKWCWEPFFEEVVVGCLVRVGIGPNAAGQPVYRICEVAAVDAKEPTRQYKFEGRLTHKYLDLRWGENRARWQMVRMSDKEPLRHEFDEWLRELDREGLRRMTVSDVTRKKEELRKAGNYVYSAADVKKMLEEKRLADARPRNVAVEKDRLSKELAMAEDKGDTMEVERLVHEIASLDAWAQTQGVKDKRVLQLTKMNKRNKAENFRVASEALSKQNAKEGEADYDPFSRRWTRSQNYYKTPAGGEAAPKLVEELGKEKAEKEALLEKAKKDGEAPEVVAKLANEVATVGNELRNTLAPMDGLAGLMAKHMFDLPLSLEPLQRWGPPHEAYMARKRKQEASCGPPVGLVVGRKVGTTLTVNDYKRRRGLL